MWLKVQEALTVRLGSGHVSLVINSIYAYEAALDEDPLTMFQGK